MKNYRLYKTRNGARRAWEKLAPVDGYVDEHKVKAAASLKAEADSFERCDTDGFVSQWCHTISARGSELEHDIAMHGGMDVFRVLVDAETGKLVSTKCFVFDDKYSYGSRSAWLVNGANGNGDWVSDMTKEKTLIKKGFRYAWIVAPAYVSTSDPLDRRKPSYGFSGLHTVSYKSLLARDDAGLKI